MDRIIDRLKVGYQNLILVALSNKYLVMGLIAIMFFASLVGFTKIAFVFFPDSDRNMITVDVNLPSGTKIEETSAIVEAIDQ